MIILETCPIKLFIQNWIFLHRNPALAKFGALCLFTFSPFVTISLL